MINVYQADDDDKKESILSYTEFEKGNVTSRCNIIRFVNFNMDLCLDLRIFVCIFHFNSKFLLNPMTLRKLRKVLGFFYFPLFYV